MLLNVSFAKKHKVLVGFFFLFFLIFLVVLSVFAFLTFSKYFYKNPYYKKTSSYESPSLLERSSSLGVGRVSFPSSDNANTVDSVSLNNANRKTKEDISISLKVKDVSRAVDTLSSLAKSMGGFVVSKNIRTNKKEDSPVSYSTLTVRVPKEVKEGFTLEAKKVGLRVVSETENLQDITDQYEDLDQKLALLQKNKNRFEEIMHKADTVDEILKVQNQILNLQRQIDSIKGKKKYLEEVSKSVKITFYLSTDEYSLPYVPKDNWSLKTVFTKAVRSLVKTFRLLISLLVWVVVFSPLWILIYLVVKFLKTRFFTSKK